MCLPTYDFTGPQALSVILNKHLTPKTKNVAIIFSGLSFFQMFYFLGL